MLSSLIISLALTSSPTADAAELSLFEALFLPKIEVEADDEPASHSAEAKKGKGGKKGSKTSSKKGSSKKDSGKKADKPKKGSKPKADKERPKSGNAEGQSRNGDSNPNPNRDRADSHERPDRSDRSDRAGDGHPHAHDVHAERPDRPQPGATPHSAPEHRPVPRGEAPQTRPAQASNGPNGNAHQANETRRDRTQQANQAHAHSGGHVRPGDRPPAARPGPAHPHVAKHGWRPHRFRPVPHRLGWTVGWFVHPHYTVVVGGGGSTSSSVASVNRKVDRYDTFSVGTKVGSTLGAYEGQADSAYSDLGVGVYGRYRLAEPLGLELAYTYSSTSDPDAPLRYSHTLQPSLQVFLFPWTRVSPYGTAGLTFDTTYDADRGTDGQSAPVKDSAWGGHVGLGIEFAIGDNLALDLEARAIQYVEGHPDTLDSQIQTHAGLSWYF